MNVRWEEEGLVCLRIWVTLCWGLEEKPGRASLKSMSGRLGKRQGYGMLEGLERVGEKQQGQGAWGRAASKFELPSRAFRKAQESLRTSLMWPKWYAGWAQMLGETKGCISPGPRHLGRLPLESKYGVREEEPWLESQSILVGKGTFGRCCTGCEEVETIESSG